MKINELLQEGLWDYAKGLVKTSSLAGASAASQQAQSIKNAQPYVKAIIKNWNEHVALTKNSGANAAVDWVKNVFKTDLKGITPPASNSDKDINKFLTDVMHAYRAGSLSRISDKSTQATSQPAQTPTIGATGKRQAQPTTAATQSAKNPGEVGYVSPNTGITVVQNTDPWILAYQKNSYMINDHGHWAVDGKNTNTAVASAALQSEFDKAAGEQLVSHRPKSTKTTATSAAPSQPAQQPTVDATDGHTIIGQVITPKGIKVVKWSDGIWTQPSTKEQIVRPSDLEKLEQILKQQQEESGAKSKQQSKRNQRSKKNIKNEHNQNQDKR